MKNDRFTVWFTEDGFNMRTTFESSLSCEYFATKMAKEGRLLQVKDGKKDITNEYASVVDIFGVVGRA